MDSNLFTFPLFAFDLLLVVTLVTLALGTLMSRDLFQGAVIFIVFGLLMAIAWCRLGAIDVALAEAAIGAGLTGALLINTMASARQADGDRRTGEAASSGAREDSDLDARRRRRARLAIAGATLILSTGLASVIVPLAASDMPPNAASAEDLPASGVSNPVTAVLLNFRAYDTLLEVAVLLAAVWSIIPLGRAPMGRHRATRSGYVLLSFIRVMVPIAILVAAYILWTGTKAPGGAFQSAAMLTAVLVLLLVGPLQPPRFSRGRWRALLVAGPALFLLVGIDGALRGKRFLEYRLEWAGGSILLIEIGLTISIALVLTMLFNATSPNSSSRESRT